MSAPTMHYSNAAGIARAFMPTGLLIAGDGTEHITTARTWCGSRQPA